MKRPRLLLLLLTFAAALLAYLLYGLPRREKLPLHAQFPGKVSEILGKQETCMNCHETMKGFAPAHQPQIIGCSPCHRGDPRAKSKSAAHEGLIALPGNLEDVFLTCGTKNCHQSLALRVKNSLMSSMSGVVTVDRFVFGQQDSLSGHAHIAELNLAAPADVHLRHLCASCHLGNKKQHFGPILESSRGGGCNACHLNYSEEAKKQLTAYQKNKALPTIHPALTLETGNDKCFGCHSRSGRISTNYEGWHETQLTEQEVGGKTGYRKLADGRIFEFIAPDVHHLAGLECVDCHRAGELMGDGKRYAHEEEAVRVQCADCHFADRPKSLPFRELDEESQKILALRKLPYQGRQFVVGPASGEALLNVWLDSTGLPFLVEKNAGQRHPLSPPAQACLKGKAHASLSCSACHTGWAPQCVGCHTSYEAKRRSIDLLDKKERRGKWVEYLGEFFPEAPSLGVVEKLEGDSALVRQIKAFIPGMIMTIDASAFPKSSASKPIPEFHRLFAPAAPHTTTSKGRSCQSCHTNPLALGYGRGQLIYEKTRQGGQWTFIPEYAANLADGLPEDAWIGFLQQRSGTSSTRPKARPFNLAEQQRILGVGACLNCHDGNAAVMQQMLHDPEGVRRKVSAKCVLPVWPVEQ